MAKDFTPREYQGLMIDHQLTVPRSGLWAGMGLGKTVASLTAIDAEFLSGECTKPALVLAPLRVARSTWPDEAAKWNHLKDLEVVPIVGSVDDRRRALRHRNGNVFTINYENLPWLIEELNGRWPFGRVIADESTKLKSFRLRQGGKRARAIARVAHTVVERWTNLTGTPSPNGLQDLWGQTWFLDAGQRLGRSFHAFEQRWFRSEQVSSNVNAKKLSPHEHAQAEIEERLKDICLSLNAADYFDLAEPVISNVYVELPKKVRAMYEDMEKRMFLEIEGNEIEAMNAATKTMKCLQLANGAAYIEGGNTDWVEVHDLKIQALESIIEEAAGMPVLVAYNFRSDLVRLQKHFKNARVLDDNPQTIKDWNAGKIPILLSHPASAGHGLNLQDGGNILVFFGHSWNLEEYLQIIERIGPTRQLQAGHDRAMFVYHILAKDTVDEMVMYRRKTKRQVQDILMEAMKHKGRHYA